MSDSPGYFGTTSGRIARLIGVCTALGGLLALAWPGLSGHSAGGAQPTTTLIRLALVFLGTALWVQARVTFSRAHRPLVFALSLPPVCIGAAALAGFPPFAGSLEIAPAIGLVLLGLVAGLPDFAPIPRSRPLQAFLVVVIWGAMLNVATVAYGTSTPNTFSHYVGMPAWLALVFLVFALGALFARSRTGILGTLLDPHAGGVMARFLLPLVILSPFTVGWLRIYGIRHGYYDSYFGYAQFATTNVVVFALFIWISARVLNQTDAKRLEAMAEIQQANLELTRLNASLESRIRQHYVAEEARKKAELQLFQSQKMEALGTLASGIAHDFNNILTIILLNTDLARETLGAPHPAARNLDEIQKAGNRAANLIRQIMTFGQRNDSGLKPIRLDKVIGDAISILRHSFPPDIRIESETAGAVPLVNANPSHIEQVIINLGANAAHAMAGQAGLFRIVLDGVTITPEKAALSASVREGRYARVTVSDSGHGMDTGTRRNIFDPFFTTKEPGEGSGLGLSVVHGIMKLHGGSVTVYSEPGRGTVFSLYFPASAGSPADAPPLAELIPRGKGERVLCVDDDESIVSAVSVLLEKLGYHTTVHHRAGEALADFKAHPGRFDLVLTDFSMPGMSGLALTRALRELHPGIPVVLMSGYLRPEDAEEALRAGIGDVILKPDLPEKLPEIVHRRLASRSAN